ncbi:MAG: class I SAM-dependent methyltransferase [Odoribacter sp.]|nr:class I SAM-dependent methyltransferase [Odoribacter sp.]
MKENIYDKPSFFNSYSQMTRSVKGLEGAGEWHELRKLLPDFSGKDVLDLGCGFGWHCQYAAEKGAKSVIGIDISEKMITEAIHKNKYPNVHYKVCSIEDYSFPKESFDIVISSLAFHYIKSFEKVCQCVHTTLRKEGVFVFSVEHPVFTAQGRQQWHYDDEGKILHWPIDNYFQEGQRKAIFLEEEVTKYHRTLSTYLGDMLKNGFELIHIVEPQPEERLLKTIPEMKNELRRPLFLIVAGRKK